MRAYRVLKPACLFPALRLWTRLRDVPSNLLARRLDFGTCGVWLAGEGTAGLLTTAGYEMPFHVMYPAGVQLAILGQRDFAAARGTEWDEAWETSMAARVARELDMSPLT